MKMIQKAALMEARISPIIPAPDKKMLQYYLLSCPMASLPVCLAWLGKWDCATREFLTTIFIEIKCKYLNKVVNFQGFQFYLSSPIFLQDRNRNLFELVLLDCIVAIRFLSCSIL